ncbi:UNVERIFIED_CONTAM: X-X-X-Leu-X-X-Gly heptad repeat protein [Pseudacidovorax intermedius]|nr:X-X-X-Leu-X-X-Gly heptad repeat protein [Pseudacidovorax intermedius]
MKKLIVAACIAGGFITVSAQTTLKTNTGTMNSGTGTINNGTNGTLKRQWYSK